MFELVFVGTCNPPRGAGRAFGGPIDPQFAPGTTFPLELGRRVTMGRAKEADILVDSLIVARHHLAITLVDHKGTPAVRVENLGGALGAFTLGTYIADEKLVPIDTPFELGGVLRFVVRPVATP